MCDTAGQAPDRLHLLNLAKLSFRSGPFGRFRLQRFVRFRQLAGPVADGLVELHGSPAFTVGLPPRPHTLVEGPPGEVSETDRPEPDQDREESEPVGISVGFGHQASGLSQSSVEIEALRSRNFFEHGA